MHNERRFKPPTASGKRISQGTSDWHRRNESSEYNRQTYYLQADLLLGSVNCRAATALRMAAQSLHHSKSALGDFYRRMRAKLGAPKAITAAAHKLARIIFHLVTTGQEFDNSHFAADQLRFHKHQEAKLRAKARALGFQLTPFKQAASMVP